MILRRAVASAGLSATLVLTGGCGFIFVNAPPNNHQSQSYIYCTESNVGPVLDMVWAGLNLLGAMSVSSETSVDPAQTRTVRLAWTVVSGRAAFVGFDKNRRCREAKRLLAERQAGAQASPQAVSATGGAAIALSPQAVSIGPAADTIRAGESVQLVAEARASSGVLIQGASFTWSSSNDAIASVNGAGLVTGHAAGAVVVAARTGTVVGTASILVTPR